MYVRDQFIRARPLVRAAARGRQAAQAQRGLPVALPRYARADSLACLVSRQEQERRRLGRELHDGLGPTLAGLALGLDPTHVLSAGQSDLQQLLGGLKAETQRTVTEVRRIVCGLRPPMLDELGLAEVRRVVGLAGSGDVVSADGVTRWRPR